VQQQAPPPPPPPPVGVPGSLVINEFIGRRVKLYWPEEGGWFEAIISDFNAASEEHCLTYNINTPAESFEWVNLRVRFAFAFACAGMHSIPRA
jgi:hypothetical protein